MSLTTIHTLKQTIAVLLLLLYGSMFYVVDAVYYCQPPFNGNRTVEADCTYPTGGIKVYGDIVVGARTITVPSGVTLGIDLSVNKATFTTGIIRFEGTGKMDNTVSGRTFITVSYSAASGNTACPSGYAVVNTAGTGFQGGTSTNVPASGTIQCGKT